MLYNLSHLGLICISGPDRHKFLQGQLTCNIADLTSSHYLTGAYCSQAGRVQTTFIIFETADNCYLVLARDLIGNIISLLQKYAIFSKVSITDLSSAWQVVGMVGDELTLILERNNITLPPAINTMVEFDHLLVLQRPGKLSRCLMLGPSDTVSKIQDKSGLGLQNAYSHWQLMDIEVGFPTISLATMDQFTPHALNQDILGSISFNKGCYIGQEIVARTHYRGQVKQHLYRASAQVEQQLAAGDKILNQQQATVGTVINIANTGNRRVEMLVVLQDTAASAGDAFIAGQALTILPFDS